MTYGLPSSCDYRKAIPKDKLISKKNIVGNERERFDKQIHSITVRGLINPDTINISPSDDIKAIYAIEVQLNEPDYDDRILSTLNRMGHKSIYVMSYQNRCRLAVIEKTLFQTDWIDKEEVDLKITGLNLKDAWANFVRDIGSLGDDGDFEQLLCITINNRDIQKEIDRLETKLAKEKQHHIQRDLFAKIQELKKQLK